MPRTELTIKTGPAGWVKADVMRGETIVTSAWVRFTRPRGGRWQPAALFMVSPTDETKRLVSLHRIELAVNASALVSNELAERIDEPIAPGSVDFHKAFTGYGHHPEPIVLERPTGRRLDTSFYAQVADAYRIAASRGLNPRSAISGAAGVSTDVAGRWVYEARKRGLLAETTPGKVTA
jgi:hypothetical protein